MHLFLELCFIMAAITLIGVGTWLIKIMLPNLRDAMYIKWIKPSVGSNYWGSYEGINPKSKLKDAEFELNKPMEDDSRLCGSRSYSTYGAI